MILPYENHNNIRMVKIFVVAGCMFMWQLKLVEQQQISSCLNLCIPLSSLDFCIHSLDRLKFVLFRKLTWQAEVVCVVQKTHLTGWSCMCCLEKSKLTWQAEVVCVVQKTRWPSQCLECHWSSTFVWWVETSRWCWRLAYSPCWRQAWRRR